MARNVPIGATSAYSVAHRTRDEQLRSIEALDSKAGVLIAADRLVSPGCSNTSSDRYP